MEQEILEAIKLAVTNIPQDVVEALEEAYKKEECEIAKYNLELILKAVDVAKKKGVPVCQDTGTPIFFVEVGPNDNIHKIQKAIINAISRATQEVPLRPNALSVLTGKVLGNIPEIHFEPGNKTRISILMKGGGSENCSALFTLTPGEGLEGVKRKVIEHVKACGGKPCPPIIVGIGIASPAEKAMRLAKKSLFRKIGERHPNKEIARFEEELLKEINSLGIGPMGMGGKITALDVKVEVESRHPASYIVALTIQCWAHRRAFIDFDEEVRIWQ